MNRKRYAFVVTLAVLVGIGVQCGSAIAQDKGEQKHVWAASLSRPGCPNLHKVKDTLYRSGQPTVEGFQELKKLGIKTVINLRGEGSDSEGLEQTKLEGVALPVMYWNAKEEEIVKFLQIVLDKKRQPVLVHCNSGANRTGMMVAIYRVAVDGWTVEEALAEMRRGGYGSQGGGEAFDEYMKKLDVKALREKAGLTQKEEKKDEGEKAKDKEKEGAARNPLWAAALAKPGCPNLFKVSDQLYRGAQPTAEGFRQLKEMGIKTVVNLRSFHSDRDELRGIDLAYEHITMKPWHPEDKELVRFFQVVTDPARQPVFVHCQHGADRTGTMVALYRVMVGGWTKDEAVKEMTEGGFGFHSTWQNLVEYLKKLNVDEIRRRAGLVEPEKQHVQ